MKRVISIFLCIVILLGMFTCLVGCGKEDIATAGAESAITKGELLVMVCDKFGIDGYVEETPFATTVPADNEYFSVVQAAFEWEIINDTSIQVTDPVTKTFIMEALVKCVGIADTSNMTSTEILSYATANGYASFDENNKGMNSYVTHQEAINCINSAFNIWTNQKFENKEEITFKNDVKNLAESGLNSSDVYVDANSNTILVPANAISNVNINDIIIVPSNNVDDTLAAYRVEKIEIDGNNAVVYTLEADLESTIESADVSGTTNADFTKAQIIDGDGNLVTPVSETSEMPKASPMVYYGADDVTPTLCAKGKISFTVDDCKISGEVDSESLSLSVEGTLKKNEKKNTEVKVKKSIKISNFSIDHKVVVDNFELKSLLVKLNYDLKDTTALSASWTDEANLKTPEVPYEDIVMIKNIITDAISEATEDEFERTITLAKIPVVSSGIVSVYAEVKLKIKVTGAVEIVITTKNANGLEIKNGHLRTIKSCDKTIDINFKAKIEGTIYIGVSLKMVGLNIIGFGVEFGAGIEIKITIHHVDEQGRSTEDFSLTGDGGYIDELVIQTNKSFNGKIAFKTCGDIKTYLILKIKIDDDCAAAKVLNAISKISLEIEIWGKDNKLIENLSGHIENWGIVDKCTLEQDATILSSGTNVNYEDDLVDLIYNLPNYGFAPQDATVYLEIIDLDGDDIPEFVEGYGIGGRGIPFTCGIYKYIDGKYNKIYEAVPYLDSANRFPIVPVRDLQGNLVLTNELFSQDMESRPDYLYYWCVLWLQKIEISNNTVKWEDEVSLLTQEEINIYDTASDEKKQSIWSNVVLRSQKYHNEHHIDDSYKYCIKSLRVDDIDGYNSRNNITEKESWYHQNVFTDENAVRFFVDCYKNGLHEELNLENQIVEHYTKVLGLNDTTSCSNITDTGDYWTMILWELSDDEDVLRHSEENQRTAWMNITTVYINKKTGVVTDNYEGFGDPGSRADSWTPQYPCVFNYYNIILDY